MSCQGGREYLMSSSKEGEFISPISYPLGSAVVVMCHDDHQKMKGFLIRHGSWDFAPHLMRRGDATHIIAMWHVLTSGVNAPIVWLLGFPLNFSFCALVFKLPFSSLSPSLSPTSNHYSELFLLQPFSAIFFELVHSMAELFVLPFKVCFSSSPPFLYGTNIDYAQFLIFFFFFGFLGFLGFISFPPFSSFHGQSLRLG